MVLRVEQVILLAVCTVGTAIGQTECINKPSDRRCTGSNTSSALPDLTSGFSQNHIVSVLILRGYTAVRTAPDDYFAPFGAMLVVLHINSTSLERLPKISHLVNIKDLDLESNRLSNLPEDFVRPMTHLLGFSLNSNQLSSLPENLLLTNTRLHTFRANSNKLTHIPEKLFHQSSFQKIHLMGNKLTTLPEKVFSGQGTTLRELFLGQNVITVLPANLFQGLSALQTLRLENNLIQKLDKALFTDLTGLRNLHLQHNSLQAVPDGAFIKLKRLSSLDLSANVLRRWPVPMFPPGNELAFLNVNLNRFKTLPSGSLSELTNLITFTIDGNLLESFPDGFLSTNVQLTKLTADGNRLSHLPPSFLFNQTKLQNLALAVNNLSYFPPGMFLFSSDRNQLRLNLYISKQASGRLNDFQSLCRLSALKIYRFTNLYVNLQMYNYADFDRNLRACKQKDLQSDIYCTVRDGIPVYHCMCPGGTYASSSGCITLTRENQYKLNDGQCKNGELVSQSCVNQAECVAVKHKCSNNAVCGWIGHAFKYTCVCPPGYERNGDRCENIDECSAGLCNSTVSTCTDTIGSYQCTCQSGYEHKDGQCSHIDQCTRGYCTQGTCTYKNESTTCQCSTGFTFTGRDCKNIDECQIGQYQCATGTCADTDGSYQCLCPTNYEWSHSQSNCVSIRRICPYFCNCSVNSILGTFSTSCKGPILPSGISARTTHLDAQDNNLRRLYFSMFFQNTYMTHLYLQNNNLGELPVGVFAKNTNLKHLFLQNNNLQTLPVGVFSLNANLTHLYLQNNTLQTLPIGVFPQNNSLAYLYLQDNRIRTLPVGVFSESTHLTHLYLQNNNLQTLPVGVFSLNPNLAHLYLQNNTIQTLPIGVFPQTNSLAHLQLQNNKIQALAVGVFSPLTSLKHLAIENNPIATSPSSFCSLTSLKVGGRNTTITPDTVGITINEEIAKCAAWDTASGVYCTSENSTSSAGIITAGFACVCPEGTNVNGSSCNDVTPMMSYLQQCKKSASTGVIGQFCIKTSECAENLLNCSTNERCGWDANKFGYACICKAGFERLTKDTGCVDIYECSNDRAACPGTRCTEAAGSFHCVCPYDEEWDMTTQQCVNITDCPASCSCALDPVGEFRTICNAKNLSVVPVGIFPRTTHLYLQNNKIQALAVGVFSPLTSLKHLDLSNNGLATVGRGVFNLKGLSVLNLDNNALTLLDPYIFPNTPALDLSIKNNPLTDSFGWCRLLVYNKYKGTSSLLPVSSGNLTKSDCENVKCDRFSLYVCSPGAYCNGNAIDYSCDNGVCATGAHDCVKEAVCSDLFGQGAHTCTCPDKQLQTVDKNCDVLPVATPHLNPNIAVAPGGRVMLQCHIKGSTRNGVTWLDPHMGRINSSASFQMSNLALVDATIATLEITSISSDQLGTYTCVPSNSRGTARATFQVTAKAGVCREGKHNCVKEATCQDLYDDKGGYRCTCPDKQLQSADQNCDVLPAITPLLATNATIVPGRNVSFTCSVSGTARNGVTWLNPQLQRIQSSGSFHITSAVQKNITYTTLYITHISQGQFGNYTCVAGNSRGSAQFAFHVYHAAGSKESAKSTIGAVIGSLMGILILLAIIALAVVAKKKSAKLSLEQRNHQKDVFKRPSEVTMQSKM